MVGDCLVNDYLGAKNAGISTLLVDRYNREINDSITKISNLSEVLNYIL